MISTPNRRQAVDLIKEAAASGASPADACEVLDISLRTYQRWTEEEGVKADARPQAQRPDPANKLSAEERQQIVEICNQPPYQSLPPSQIVPALADQGIYLASEASFYRVLREADQLRHRGKAQAPRHVVKPKGCLATGPNQVWSWDISVPQQAA
jgi:putative transposase